MALPLSAWDTLSRLIILNCQMFKWGDLYWVNGILLIGYFQFKTIINEKILWTLHFSSMSFHLMARLVFCLFGENKYFLEKTWNHHLFLFYFIIFLRENKIRKKTLSVTSYLEKTVCEKPKLGSGIRLHIRKVR